MTTKATSSGAQPAVAPDGAPEYVDLGALLETARADTVPSGWYVWPLRRNSVLLAALKWLALAVVGLALFIPTALIMIPANFDGSVWKGILSAVILALLAAVAFGALGLAAHDFWRAARASDYLLVMTPDHFVKVTPGRTFHVPMSEVAYVTMRGVRLPDSLSEAAHPDVWSGASGPNGMFLRGGASFDNLVRRNYRRAPTSLAFMDLRRRREVIVTTDDAFDAIPILDEILRDYAHGIDYTLLK